MEFITLRELVDKETYLKHNTMTFEEMTSFSINEANSDLYSSYYFCIRYLLTNLVKNMYYDWLDSKEYNRLLLFDLLNGLPYIPITYELDSLGIDEILVLGVLKDAETQLKICTIWVILNDKFYESHINYFGDKIEEETLKYNKDGHNIAGLKFNVEYAFKNSPACRACRWLSFDEVAIDSVRERKMHMNFSEKEVVDGVIIRLLQDAIDTNNFK